MTNIFDEYIIVDEKPIDDLLIESTTSFCVDHYNCKRCDEIDKKRREDKTQFREVTQFAALEFQVFHQIKRLEIKDIGTKSTTNVPLAQIVLWEWNAEGAQVIKETKILNKGGMLSYYSGASSFVIRILQKREKTDENPCPPISSLPDDELTVHIGDSQITVSAAWLMALSPVINRMLATEMKEKQRRSITFNDLGVDMKQFKEFISAISITALHSPFFPNPTNVLYLLKLADYFQVNGLKARCEAHLINCVEIPLIDRFLLIEPYRLDKLKMLFMDLDVDKLRKFFKVNHEKFSPEILRELAVRICE